MQRLALWALDLTKLLSEREGPESQCLNFSFGAHFHLFRPNTPWRIERLSKDLFIVFISSNCACMRVCEFIYLPISLCPIYFSTILQFGENCFVLFLIKISLKSNNYYQTLLVQASNFQHPLTLNYRTGVSVTICTIILFSFNLYLVSHQN